MKENDNTHFDTGFYWNWETLFKWNLNTFTLQPQSHDFYCICDNKQLCWVGTVQGNQSWFMKYTAYINYLRCRTKLKSNHFTPQQCYCYVIETQMVKLGDSFVTYCFIVTTLYTNVVGIGSDVLYVKHSKTNLT